MDIENIIYTLKSINNDIVVNQNISLEDLKILLLIIYNEYILKQTESEIIKSYLAIILHNFIELENNYSSSQINNFNFIGLSQILNNKLPIEKLINKG